MGHHFEEDGDPAQRFNPCFNGFMDKWLEAALLCGWERPGFNPCFNGFMDKWCFPMGLSSWISLGFNPCFNGFMDKWTLKIVISDTAGLFQPLF